MKQEGQEKKGRKPKLGYDHVTPYRIRALLDEKLESGAALARAIGKKSKTINYIILGENGLSTDTLVAIAKHFGVSTDYLLGLSDVKTASAEVRTISEYTGLTAESINALHYLHSAPEEVLAKSKDPENPALRFINRALEGYYDNLKRTGAIEDGRDGIKS